MSFTDNLNARGAARPRPSLGRIVLVRSSDLTQHIADEAPAIVTRVHGDDLVDLKAFRPHHSPLQLVKVPYFDPEETPHAPGPAAGVSWRWMPCQNEVAGKTEQLLAADASAIAERDATLAAQDAQAAAVAKTANRVSLEHIESIIKVEEYLRSGPDGLLTVCVLTLANGFTVTGESAAADPANFDETLGRTIARRHAVEKIWPLEGYLLRERLHAANQQNQALAAQTAA